MFYFVTEAVGGDLATATVLVTSRHVYTGCDVFPGHSCGLMIVFTYLRLSDNPRCLGLYRTYSAVQFLVAALPRRQHLPLMKSR